MTTFFLFAKSLQLLTKTLPSCYKTKTKGCYASGIGEANRYQEAVMKIMKRKIFIVGVVVSLLSGLIIKRLEAAPTAEELFQNAFVTETAERNIEKAIEMYGEVAGQAKDNPGLASKADYRMGLCYELLGKTPEAMVAYEKAINLSTSSPTEAIENARASLVRLKQQQEKEEKIKIAEENAHENQQKEREKTAYNIEKGSQFLKLNLGVSIPLTNELMAHAIGDNLGTGNGGGSFGHDQEARDTIGGSGPTVGVEYVRYFSPHLGFGADFGFTKFLTKKTSAQSNNSVLASDPSGPQIRSFSDIDTVKSHGKSYVFLATTRLILIPEGKFHPFLTGGAGFHNTQLEISNTHQASFAIGPFGGPVDNFSFFQNTSTKSNKIGFAGMVGLGAEYNLSKSFQLDLTGRWQYLKDAVTAELLEENISPSSGNAPTPFKPAVNKSISTFNVLIQMGYKFK